MFRHPNLSPPKELTCVNMTMGKIGLEVMLSGRPTYMQNLRFIFSKQLCICDCRAGSHGSRSHLMSMRAISTVESMEVGFYLFHMGSEVLSPKYDMDAYMAL
jgi:hypothetical protein